MDDFLKELTLNGFVIYPSDDKFILQKINTPNNPLILEPKKFESYEKALEFTKTFTKKEFSNFVAIARYNRGLGIEYKNLPLIEAKNIDEARAKAQILGNQIIGESHIIEIRVRPKND